MAIDKKLTEELEATSAADDDLLYVVIDTDTTPLSRKITRANLFSSAPEVGSGDSPLRLIGEGDSVKLVHTPMGGAMYGEDISETYSLGAFDPIDGSGLTQRFSQGIFKHVYTETIAVMDATGSDVVQPIALAVDGTIQLGSGRDIAAAGTITAAQVMATPLIFADLPAIPVAGMLAYVTDSNTTTWGATIAGGASNKVLAFYNGTHWTVTGK